MSTLIVPLGNSVAPFLKLEGTIDPESFASNYKFKFTTTPTPIQFFRFSFGPLHTVFLTKIGILHNEHE